MLLLSLACFSLTTIRSQPALSVFAGRYSSGTTVLEVKAADGILIMRPLHWGGFQALDRTGETSFVMQNRRQASVAFSLSGGHANSMTISGLGQGLDKSFVVLGPAPAPIELVLGMKTREGLRGLQGAGMSSSEIMDLATQLGRSVPTHRQAALALAEDVVEAGSQPANAYADTGDLAVAAGARDVAVDYYRKAFVLDSNNAQAMTGMRMIGKGPSLIPSGIPLEKIYAAPTPAEVEAVLKEWQGRDLSPKSVREELSTSVKLGGKSFTATVLSYLVHGSRAYGVALVPKGKTGPLPVLLDLKGVSPSYQPLNVPEGLVTPNFLRGDADQFVIFAPGVRGEKVLIGGRTFQCEGDPDDSWDGAADDAIAMLNVGLESIRQADPKRISVCGKSRGGTVAMLVAERDRRINKAVSWSGPAGWIENMPQLGFTQLEQVREGLVEDSPPTGIGGQSLRTFLKGIRKEGWDVARTRRHLIASSPIYFLERLPKAQLHYGAEDFIVEAANGVAIEKRLSPARKRRVKVIIEPAGGHDLNPAISFPTTRKFLLHQ